MKINNDNIFRPKMMEKLNSPYQIEELITTTTPLGWIMLLSVLGFLLAFLFWVFGTYITTTVQGQGILLYAGSITNIIAKEDGILYSMDLKPGQMVEKDQIVARLFNYNNNVEIKKTLMQQQSSPSADQYRNFFLQFWDEIFNERYAAIIWAPDKGRILEVYKKNMDFVSKGTKLATLNIVSANSALQAKIYVSTADGKKIKPGDEVKIELDNVKAEEYGYLAGKVENISPYPVSADFIAEELGSDDLGESFRKGINGPVLQVLVSLIQADTLSGYLWTTKQGYDGKIEDGSTLKGNIVVKKQRPITIAFKWLNTFFAGSF